MEANPPIGKMIDKETTLFGFIADQATTSRLPRIFGTFFEANRLNASMVGMNIRPDDLLFTLNGMKNSQVRGALIGSEYGKSALQAMDHITKEAEIAGFIDACVVQDGKLIGHIATAASLVSMLRPKKHKRIAIWGSGAMAKAIALNLDEKGFDEVVLYVERVESAMEAIQAMGSYITQIRFDIERLSEKQSVDFSGFDYVINATPAGIFAHENLFSATAEKETVFIDFFYNKASQASLFESFAKANEAKYIGGYDIIAKAAPLHYAVWFEKEPAEPEVKITRT